MSVTLTVAAQGQPSPTYGRHQACPTSSGGSRLPRVYGWRCGSFHATARTCSGERFEGVDVARPDDREVRAVEGEDALDVETLGRCDNARVRRAQRQVGILLDEAGGAL